MKKDDIVINKNKYIDNKPHVVREVKIITNSSNFSYLVLFFNDDNTFHVAYEYEPFNKEERIEYYKIWNKQQVKNKKAIKPKVKSKSKSKISSFNINNIKNGIL